MKISGAYVKIALHKSDNTAYVAYAMDDEFGRMSAIQIARAAAMTSLQEGFRIIVTREYNSSIEEVIYELVSGVA